MTDVDSTAFMFIFICDSRRSVTEDDTQKLIFKILLGTGIEDRFDLSDDFYQMFGEQNPALKKTSRSLRNRIHGQSMFNNNRC